MVFSCRKMPEYGFLGVTIIDRLCELKCVVFLLSGLLKFPQRKPKSISCIQPAKSTHWFSLACVCVFSNCLWPSCIILLSIIFGDDCKNKFQTTSTREICI